MKTYNETEIAQKIAEDTMGLLISGESGIYLPQQFCEMEEKPDTVSDEDWETCLAGPDAEGYCEAWDSILDNWVGENGETIYQKSGLWLVDQEKLNWVVDALQIAGIHDLNIFEHLK